MGRQYPIGIDMDSRGKRRRVHDRLSDLPDCLLHGILCGLGSRQAVQTSLLSRRWRQLWRDVPCADIDEREFAGDGQWERFEDFADRVLTTIPSETQLDAFRLNLVRGEDRGGQSHSAVAAIAFERWIRRGLRHVPAAVDIRAVHENAFCWHQHLSPVFARRLTTLRLVGVSILGFLVRLSEYCPVLEDLYVERCEMDMIKVVASPKLRSLAIVGPHLYDNLLFLSIAAPGLAFIRLDISDQRQRFYSCVRDAEPLALLAEASIHLNETDHGQLNQISFFRCMYRFIALFPNVGNLRLSGFTITALLDKESQEFPVLHKLKTLLLEECDIGQNFQALTTILWKTTNLEKLGLHNCTFLAPEEDSERRKRRTSSERCSSASLLWCKNLKSIEIKLRQEDSPHLLKVLSVISEGMPTTQWVRIKKSTTFV